MHYVRRIIAVDNDISNMPFNHVPLYLSCLGYIAGQLQTTRISDKKTNPKLYISNMTRL